MSTLWELSISEAHDLLVNKEIKAVELTKSYLDRINEIDGDVNSYITVCADLALEQAELADGKILSGDCGPLTGIPVQVKDLIVTKGVATTCGSKMLENYYPVYNSTVVDKLERNGAVLLGKGNMDEFGMGSSCENSAFHPTRNPWDLGRVPGGSSGGGAAAVAAGEAAYALGSDTGGSIRQPAAMCGIVGLKPTYGLVSRYGLVAYASSLDQIGPMTRTVTDCAMVMEAIGGHDKKDATSLDINIPQYSSLLSGNIEGIRIGVPSEYFVDGIQDGVREKVEDAVEQFKRLGAVVKTVSLPTTKYALACYYILAPSECSANLARYDGVKYGYSYQDTSDVWEAMEQTRKQGFGMEVKRRIMIGTYALSSGYYDAYYLKAQQVRTLIRQEFSSVFSEIDALVTPTSPTVAFKHGDKTDDPVQMYLVDVCTIPANIAGLPAMSLPCGFVEGLPVGLQLIGPQMSEARMLNIAFAYEQSADWYNQRPTL